MSLANINSGAADTDDQDYHAEPHSSPEARPAIFQLADGILDRSLNARTKAILIGASGRVVITNVPSASYVGHLALALRRLNPRAHLHSVAEAKRKSFSEDNQLSYLGQGRTVLAVTQNPALLQANIQAAVDLTIDVLPPDAKLVRKVINSVTGRRARGLVDADLAGIDFEPIAAAIRPGSTAAECVQRLKRLSTHKKAEEVSGPDATALPLFGEAKVWAAETLANLERLRTGVIAPAELEHVLLFGPPGTGKTVLARAVAKAAGIKFFDTSVSSWFLGSDGHLDGVLKAADAFFQTLADNAPCLGLLDEIEALPDRATIDSRHREWWNSVITGVLLMVTRTRNSGKPILLIGATNYADRVDAALKRPGRLGRHVHVRPAESQEELAEVLAFYLGDVLAPSELTFAALLVSGATPALIEEWSNAARRSARDADRAVALDDLLMQIAPPDRRAYAERLNVATHEAGHAIGALVTGFDLKSVSIVVSGSMAGQTVWQRPASFQTIVDIENQVVVALCGRAADEILGSGADAGSRSDFEGATRLLASAETIFGLREQLVFRSDEGSLQHLLKSDPELLARVDNQLRQLMDRARILVRDHREAITEIAENLVDRRILSGAEAAIIFNKVTNKGPSVANRRDHCQAVSSDACANLEDPRRGPKE